MKKVAQFIVEKASSDNIIEGKKVSHLGIQASPGSKFQLNFGQSIIMGQTGIYELDLEIPVIESLVFETLENDVSAQVDIVYEEDA